MNLLKEVIKSIDDVKIKDIKIYETKRNTPYYDYVIVGSAANSRQLNATIEHLRKDSKEKNFEIRGVEGKNGGVWVLIDLHDVIVHIFLTEEREKYDLDQLFRNLPQTSIEELL